MIMYTINANYVYNRIHVIQNKILVNYQHTTIKYLKYVNIYFSPILCVYFDNFVNF